jgi:flagellin
MPLSINTNIASMTAQRSFLNSNAALETSFERLATGKRINSAVDDAAGLAIGKDLESRVSGLNQAIRNVNDGISMVQIAEGAYDEVTTILQRMRDLAVQAANGSLSTTEQGYLDTEQEKLATAIDAAIDSAKFNGTDLIDADGQSFTLQSGAASGDSATVTTSATGSATALALGVDATSINLAGTAEQAEDQVIDSTGLDFSGTTLTVTVDGETYTAAAGSTITTAVAALNTALTGIGTFVEDGTDMDFTFAAKGDKGFIIVGDGTTDVTATAGDNAGTSKASTAISAIDTALGLVASHRASLGATQSQLESTVRNLSNVAENTAAAAGRIMDTDYAAETANLTKAQILQQAATSILAQANAQPQAVLSLLQ